MGAADTTLTFDVIVREKGGVRTIEVVTRAVDGNTDALKRQGQQSTRTGQQVKTAADKMREALEHAHTAAIREDTARAKAAERSRAAMARAYDAALREDAGRVRSAERAQSAMDRLHSAAIKEDHARNAAREKEHKNTKLTIADLGDLAKVGTRVGSALTQAFSSGAELSAKNPYLILAAGAAVAAGAQVALAAVAGAALTGLGAGFLALSLKSLQSSDQIVTGMENISETATSVMSDAAQTLEDDWLKLFARIENSIVHVGPAFEHIWEVFDRSDVFDGLADGLDGLINNMMPGLVHSVEAAVPALERFAAMLPAIGTSLGNFFDSLGDSGEGAMIAFEFVLKTVLTTLEMLGWAIENVTRPIATMTSAIDSMTMGGLSKFIGLNRESTSAMDGSSEAAKTLAHAHSQVADELQKATFWTKSFTEAQGLLKGEHIAVASAEIASIDANKSFQNALKESKGALDGKTEAARKTQGALISALESAGKFSDAMFAESEDADGATAAFYKNVEALRSQTRAGTDARARIDALIAGFVAARPKALSSAQAIESMNTQIRLLRDKQVVAKAKGDSRELDALQRKINALHGKTLLITVNRQYSGLLSGQLDYYGSPIKKSAGGGRAKAGTPYIVGDGGRSELFVPDSNGRILPQVPTGGGGGTVRVVYDTTRGNADSEFLRLLRKIVRIEGGGNVQTALGA